MVFDRLSAKKVEDEMASSLEGAGKKGGANFLRELKAQFDRRLADLKVQLSSGLIDPREFRKQSDLAARQFNAGITKGMEEARRQGTLTEKEYVKLSRQLKRTGDEGASAWDRMKRGILGAGATLAAYFGARQIARFVTGSIREANEAAAVWNRLAGALDTVGVAFADVEDHVRDMASAMQRTTVVGDEEFAAVLTELVTTSGDYAGSLQNVQLVADLAAAKQIDLSTAAKLVGRVMVGEEGTLKRYGIVVQEGADALEVMRQKFAGMAQNEARTFAGQMKQLNNAWGDFKEALGEALIDASNGTSILDRVTRSVYYLTENIGDLVAVVGNLARALVLVAGATVLGKFVLALRAANFALITFSGLASAAWRSLMGPVGFAAAVLGLTTLFQKLGKASRDAAREAREALDDYKAAASEANDFNLALMESSLDAMEAAVRARLAQIRHGGAAVREEQKRLIAELNGIQQRMGVLSGERNRRNLPTGTPADGETGASETAKAQAAELERINRELAIRLTMQEQNTTRDLAAEFVRRQEILTGVTRQTVTDIQDGWAKLDAMDLLSRAGLDKPMTPEVKITPVDREMEHWGEKVAVSSEKNAKRTSSAWVNELEIIADQVEAKTGLFSTLADAWAFDSWDGVRRAAIAFARDSAAQAIRQAALAFGSLFGFNPGKAAAHFQSAALHGAAAAAFKAIGGGGGAATGIPSTAPPDVSAGTRAEPARQDVTLIFTGKGWPAMDADFQRSVHAAGLLARERFGNNVNLHIKRQ
jgi:hypothetical protein